MKKMTCRQLGGACDQVFRAETFEEMTELSRKHGMAMFLIKDKPHMEAMKKMKVLMKNEEAFKNWMDERINMFNKL
jgi:hypothetical protein